MLLNHRCVFLKVNNTLRIHSNFWEFHLYKMETLFITMLLCTIALATTNTKTSCKAQKRTDTPTNKRNAEVVLDCAVTKIRCINLVSNSDELVCHDHGKHEHFAVKVKDADDEQSSVFQMCRNPSCDSTEVITTATPYLHSKRIPNRNSTIKGNFYSFSLINIIFLYQRE